MSSAPCVVIAPDSFKGCLTASDVAAAIARGVQLAWPDAQVRCLPMADGGEGTTDVLLSALGGERRQLTVCGPLGQPVLASWALLPSGQAVIELAQAAGLPLLSAEQRNPLLTTSYGVGQMILDALDAGVSSIVLALGGSACHEGGAGLLQALGARLMNARGQVIQPGGAALAEVCHVDVSSLDVRLQHTPIEVLCDVDNPLCGPRGASAMFAPQKGASQAQVGQLDAALAHWADAVATVVGEDYREVPGVGAAGGVAFAALAVLGAPLVSGAQRIAQIIGLPQAIGQADWVITGEGCLDAQTLRGKVPAGVIRLAHEHGVPVVAIAGSLAPGYELLYEHGLTAAFSLVPGPVSLAQAYDQAESWLTQRTFDLLRVLAAGTTA